MKSEILTRGSAFGFPTGRDESRTTKVPSIATTAPMQAPSWMSVRALFLAGFWTLFAINAIVTRQTSECNWAFSKRRSCSTTFTPFATQRIAVPIDFAADLKKAPKTHRHGF